MKDFAYLQEDDIQHPKDQYKKGTGGSKIVVYTLNISISYRQEP